MTYDIAEFDVETDAFYLNVRLEPATMRGPGFVLNGQFVPLQNRDEAREALRRVLDEIAPNKDYEEAIAEAECNGRDEGWDEGYDAGRDEGWDKGREEGREEGFSAGWDEGHAVGESLTHDAYASGYNDGWDAANTDSEPED